MTRFTYICADAGIPLPGVKGSSIHVQSICRALRGLGLAGEIYAARAEGAELEGFPVRPLNLPRLPPGVTPEAKERALVLSFRHADLAAVQRPDFIYERYSLWNLSGIARARELGVPFILEVNSPLPDEARRYRALHNDALAEGVAQLLFEEADGISCVSQEVAHWVQELSGRDDGIWVIPNGVDVDQFAPRRTGVPGDRPRELPQNGAPVFAFASSFRPWHGIDNLLAAFTILKRELVHDAHLLCIGDGPELGAFQSELERLGLREAVHFTGRVPHAEVPRWLAAADVAVAPYPPLGDFYFSPIKIFEFLAMGLPVVASASGQIAQLVPHQERGLLVPPGDARELARACAWLAANRAEAARFGAAGRAWVVENATWSCRARELLRRIEGIKRA